MSVINTGTTALSQPAPSADAVANSSIADVVGNKEDATIQAVGTDKSVVAYLKGLVNALVGTPGIASWAAAAAPANAVSLSEAIRYICETIVGAQADAAVQASGTASAQSYLKGILDVLSGSTGITTFPAAAAAANGISLAEVIRHIQEALIGAVNATPVADTVEGAAATTQALHDKIMAILQRIGTDSANNTAATTLVAANRDGSILERLEHLNAGKAGELLPVKVTVVSSAIPNNTQTGGAITGAASGDLILEDILINQGTTGIVAPTNIEFSTDNVAGKTGAGAPIFLEAVAGLGANATASKKDATSHSLPMLLESGKKIFIHGDDAAGTGAGISTITLMFRRGADGATITGVNLP